MAPRVAAAGPLPWTPAMTAPAADGFDVWKGSLPFEVGLPGASIAMGDYKLLEAPLTPSSLN
jgi:hypothetical protein